MIVFKIVLIAAIVVWIIAIYLAYGDGAIGRRAMNYEHIRANNETDMPPLSVIIVTHDQASALRRHLPEILNQDYERFEVIVVDMHSTDETKDILERLEMQYANLRHTYVPASARDISLQRLALTLGIRSATNEWVVITRPDCRPASPSWLQRIGETIAKPRISLQSRRLKTPDMVLGIGRYGDSCNSVFEHKTGFHRLWNTIANIDHILNCHAAMRADACNIAYRKSFFLKHGGFGAQDLKGGAEELLVNYNSTATNTAILLSPSALVIQDPIGNAEQWLQERIFYAETRRHQHHSALYRFKQFMRMLFPWLVLFFILIRLIISIIMLFIEPTSETAIITIVMCLLVVSYYTIQIMEFRKTALALDCHNYSLSIPYLELCIPLWNIKALIGHRLAARNEFRKKFV